MRKGQVLVLNFDYSPITICTVQRAFVLVFLDKAQMLAPLSNFALHTVNATYEAPAVIRLNEYINRPYKGVVLTRQNIFKRDGHQCQYCGSTKELTLDHVVPRSHKGSSSWTNLVTACKRCNSRKGNYTPEMAGLKLRSKPTKPSYIDFLRDSSGLMKDEWRPFLDFRKTG
jgi:5-methylcytosine-specific restriction endonuclease McrA